MSNNKGQRLPKALVVAAMAVGVGGGSYGIASAASGGSSASGSSTPTTATAAQATPTATAPSAPNAQNPWGGQRSDETLLTGETAAKVRQIALARVSGATIVRVETDADGHAAYEAHMVKTDGTPVTVYVDKQFNVVSVESR
jgi:Peptidase propeptide and YPEB domain